MTDGQTDGLKKWHMEVGAPHKNEFLHIYFSRVLKLIFQNICFPNQFPVAASIKRWPNPLKITGQCSI